MLPKPPAGATPSPKLNRKRDKFDHWHAQAWHCKLPAGLTTESKRKRVVAALRRAVEEYSE
jgi:hypothetical protein